MASFVTTWMDEEAQRLMGENINKNNIDQDEYPQTTEIQNRCVNILARLFHAPEHEGSIGTATVGSSEAIHLAGLALKWNWRKHRQALKKPTDRPNIVMGENVQVCWEKFARYFDVEPRLVPLTHERFVLGVKEALARVDENTIANERFRLLSKRGHLPVIAFGLKDSSRYTVFDLSAKLRERGWIVPAYTMAPDAQDIAVLRIVVREGLSQDMADLLLNDLNNAVAFFEARASASSDARKSKTRGVF